MNASGPADWPALKRAALEAREHAYAPYSGFKVGAALRAADASIFVGCNVENASYGLSMCAERNAVGSAIGAGHQEFVALAIVADSDPIVMPCGMCRQVILEFSRTLVVRCYDLNDGMVETDAQTLLPHGFSPAHLTGKPFRP